MRWAIFLVSVTLSFLVAADWPQEGPNQATEVIPQAQPVLNWLQAVKDGDEKQLKTVFSESLRKGFEEEGWNKVLKGYQEVFKSQFGDYRLEDFTFEYRGGEDKGKLTIFHKSKKLPGLRVIKEQTDWKVNEQ